MEAGQREALLSDVKNYLDITWEDPGTDKKVSGYIASGVSYLNSIAGEPLDYLQEGADGRTLLMEYVRYARDGAMDVFENNYRHLLLDLRNRRGMIAYAADAVPAGE